MKVYPAKGSLMGSDEQKSMSIPSVRYPATDALSALRAPRRDLRVAEGETAIVGPGAREANSFHSGVGRGVLRPAGA